MRLFKRVLKKTILIYFRMILMRIKNVKDLNLKTRWFDNINDDDDMKVVNDMKDLSLKMFSFEILICLKRLRMSRAKESMIESKSNEKERWSDLESKALLCCVLGSVFNSIIMIALNNRMLNNPKFDEIAAWYFVITSLANVVMMMMLLWLLYIVARLLSFMTRYCEQINVSQTELISFKTLNQLMSAIIMLSHNNEL